MRKLLLFISLLIATQANAVPTFTAGPTLTGCSPFGCTFSLALDADGTNYGVACPAGSIAPTTTEAESGECHGGTPAPADSSIPASTFESLITVGQSLTNPEYDFYFVGTYGGQHMASPVAVTGQLLTPPSTCGLSGALPCQYVRLSSVDSKSSCAPFNTTAAVDIVADDIIVAPRTLHPNIELALVLGADCIVTFSGPSATNSRQDFVPAGIFTHSTQTFNPDVLRLWINNRRPDPPLPGTTVFLWTKDVPIVPISLDQFCPDPDLDSVSVTDVSGLVDGVSISNGVISGIPTTSGISTLELECCDSTEDCVDWN